MEIPLFYIAESPGSFDESAVTVSAVLSETGAALRPGPWDSAVRIV